MKQNVRVCAYQAYSGRGKYFFFLNILLAGVTQQLIDGTASIHPLRDDVQYGYIGVRQLERLAAFTMCWAIKKIIFIFHTTGKRRKNTRILVVVNTHTVQATPLGVDVALIDCCTLCFSFAC